jgi:hypothetical protein
MLNNTVILPCCLQWPAVDMDIPKHMKKNGMELEMKKGRESGRKGT